MEIFVVYHIFFLEVDILSVLLIIVVVPQQQRSWHLPDCKLGWKFNLPIERWQSISVCLLYTEDLVHFWSNEFYVLYRTRSKSVLWTGQLRSPTLRLHPVSSTMDMSLKNGVYSLRFNSFGVKKFPGRSFRQVVKKLYLCKRNNRTGRLFIWEKKSSLMI